MLQDLELKLGDFRVHYLCLVQSRCRKYLKGFQEEKLNASANLYYKEALIRVYLLLLRTKRKLLRYYFLAEVRSK